METITNIIFFNIISCAMFSIINCKQNEKQTEDFTKINIADDYKTEKKAKTTHTPFKVVSISGTDHHSYIYDFVAKIIVPKINKNIDFTTDPEMSQEAINNILNYK